MKRLIYSTASLFLFSLCLGLASCGAGGAGSSKNTPEAVTKQFLEAIGEGDFETAKSLCTKETAEFVAMFESFAEEHDFSENETNIESVECTEEGDKANCIYCCNDQGNEDKLTLAKVDGKWLVAIDKDDLDK